MKYLLTIVVVVFVCIGYLSNGQQPVSKNSPTYQPGQTKISDRGHVVYNVRNGDTWYGIARKFGISYPELRLANKGSDDKLVPGREIFIPSEKLKPDDPFFNKKYIDTESKTKAANGESQYHTVTKSQTLFSIAKMHNVTVDKIKEWNKLTSNTISVGQKLIVGKNDVKSSPVNQIEDKTGDFLKAENSETDLEKHSDANTALKNNENIIKYDKKNPDPAIPIEEKPAAMIQNSTPVENIPEPLTDASRENIVFANGRQEVNENGFAELLEDNDLEITDKYYGLHRSAPMGTIIRVLNMANSRKIYIKVTGQLSESDESNDVLIKISKSSAETLGVTSKKFKVNLLYGVSKD